MQVTGAIDRTHASHTDDFLDHVSAGKRCPRGKLYI
jgi:hypothetical protein